MTLVTGISYMMLNSLIVNVSRDVICDKWLLSTGNIIISDDINILKGVITVWYSWFLHNIINRKNLRSCKIWVGVINIVVIVIVSGGKQSQILLLRLRTISSYSNKYTKFTLSL